MAIGDKCKKHARQILNLPRVYINIGNNIAVDPMLTLFANLSS